MKQRHDNVRVIKPDGTMIEGHDAVTAHFDEEQRLLDAHGPTITFEVYRINMSAITVAELQGEMLAKIKVAGDFVAGRDTVSTVKGKLRALFEERSRLEVERGTPPNLSISEANHITLHFGGRRMRDEKTFYADHFMVLPVWVQVFLHDCEFEKVVELAEVLRAFSPR